MEIQTDQEIVQNIVDALGITSLQRFAKELGYSNASSIYHLMKNLNGRKINESFIDKVLGRYPQINELYLRKKSDVILINNPMKTSMENVKNSFTINDLPTLMLDLINEQKKTNELLMELLNKD